MLVDNIMPGQSIQFNLKKIASKVNIKKNLFINLNKLPTVPYSKFKKKKNPKTNSNLFQSH